MTVSDLIDLEAQLARDRLADPAALEARDAGFASAGDRRTLLRRWLDARRESEPGRLWAGRTIAGALRGVRAALVVLGLVLGWSAATALLRYTGAEPVNVWDFLLALVGLQLLLFALLLASFFLPVAALGRPVVGLVRGAVAAVYPRLAARALPGSGAEWAALWHRLRSRRSLYHHVEPWILLGLTQSFGVAFNIGALLGCLRLIVFSDIAFSWSTTLVQLDSARFHAIVHAFAAPFGWLWPDADPSRALVEATRYSRLERAYVLSGSGRAARPEMVGGWWPFLLSAVAFYGLLPRCATLAAAQIASARLLARLPLDDVEVTRLVRRLTQPRVETRSPSAESPAPATAPAAPRSARAPEGTRSFVVLWRDVPRTSDLEAAVARQTGAAVAAVQAAGGRDYEEGQLDWTRLADGADPVVVVAEGWEAPDKALHRLLRDLRKALGPRRHLVVLLARVDSAAVRGASEPELRIWEESLATLGDPYVGVETLGAAP
jgi:hypothetical protein